MEAHRALIAKRLQGTRGLRSQTLFADKLGMPPQTLSKYESGRIPSTWLVLTRLHDVEGIDLNALLTAKENSR